MKTLNFDLLLQKPQQFFQHKQQYGELIKHIRYRTYKYLREKGMDTTADENRHVAVFNQLYINLFAKNRHYEPGMAENYVNRAISNTMVEVLTLRNKTAQNTRTTEDIIATAEHHQPQQDNAEKSNKEDSKEDRQLVRAWLVYQESEQAVFADLPFARLIADIRPALLAAVEQLKQRFKTLIPSTRERDIFTLQCYHHTQWSIEEIADLLEISEGSVYYTRKTAIEKLQAFKAKFEAA